MGKGKGGCQLQWMASRMAVMISWPCLRTAELKPWTRSQFCLRLRSGGSRSSSGVSAAGATCAADAPGRRGGAGQVRNQLGDPLDRRMQLHYEVHRDGVVGTGQWGVYERRSRRASRPRYSTDHWWKHSRR